MNSSHVSWFLNLSFRCSDYLLGSFVTSCFTAKSSNSLTTSDQRIVYKLRIYSVNLNYQTSIYNIYSKFVKANLFAMSYHFDLKSLQIVETKRSNTGISAMTFAWCIHFAVDWWVASHTELEGSQKAVLSALAVTLLSFLLIFGLDKVADTDCFGESKFLVLIIIIIIFFFLCFHCSVYHLHCEIS